MSPSDPPRLQAGITREAHVDDLPTIAVLADEIWRSHYPGIISSEQIDYMLSTGYSLDVLQKEITEGGVHYFIRETDGLPIGFASVGATSLAQEHKLHKLYIKPAFHRHGHGHALLEAAKVQARKEGANRLILCVNKRNSKAIEAYDRYGFVIRESIQVAIGRGFVMDDFVMEMALR